MRYYFENINVHNIHAAARFVQKYEYCCVDLAEQLRLCLYPKYEERFIKAALAYSFDCGDRYKNGHCCGYSNKDMSAYHSVEARGYADVYTDEHNGIYADRHRQKPSGICCAVLLLSRCGLLFHCIDERLPHEAVTAFYRFFLHGNFPYKKLYVIVGNCAHTLLLEKLISAMLPVRLDAAMAYYLMRRSTSDIAAVPFDTNVQLSTHSAITIKKAGIQDAAELFPLQLDYEMTEVAYKDRVVNAAVCRLSLQKRLKSGYVYKAVLNGRIVAKAECNAQGFHWMQIGGVYTAPAYRSRGIAAAVIAYLIADLSNSIRSTYGSHADTRILQADSRNAHAAGGSTHAAGVKPQADSCTAQMKGIALFVKRGNSAAQRVYEKQGFERCGLFRLSYWKHAQKRPADTQDGYASPLP